MDFTMEQLHKIKILMHLASDNVDGAVWSEYYHDDYKEIMEILDKERERRS